MRAKLGRPDLDRYRDRFDLPAAGPDSPVTITWMGVSTLLVDDGSTPLLTDGFFSRPGLLDVATRRISPSPVLIDDALSRAGITRLDAVLPVHTHYDHALDSAVVAARTGALVVGGTSAANIARGQGLPEDRIKVVAPGTELGFGAFTVRFLCSEHCPPDRFPGEITAPVVSPAKTSAFRCGEAWSIVMHHRTTDRRLLIQGSAGFVAGALDGVRAEVVYLGVGQLGLQPRDYIERYWNETVRTVGARQVVLIHWDDFFRPLSKPLRAIPFAGDDLDLTMQVLGAMAEKDGFALHFPTLWQRSDPWA